MNQRFDSKIVETRPAQKPGASLRKTRISRRAWRYAAALTLLAFLSTLAGFQAARFNLSWAKWLHATHEQAASTALRSSALVSANKSDAKLREMETISHLAPQQQAERLLELAIERDDDSLELIRQSVNAWRGHLEDTDRLFHLVLAALNSDDPRVRSAAVEIDLVASNLTKSTQSVAQLLHQIHNEPDSRYLALWRLGALGNRGVEPATVLSTLLRYAHDPQQETRYWAIEGLAMLGTEDSINPLLAILAHDPSEKIRERAACSLARSGMLTREQRLTAVPQLLNLLDDDSLEPGTQDLVYAALHAITGAAIGKNAEAWREWWAHHDQPENRVHVPKGLILA